MGGGDEKRAERGDEKRGEEEKRRGEKGRRREEEAMKRDMERRPVCRWMQRLEEPDEELRSWHMVCSDRHWSNLITAREGRDLGTRVAVAKEIGGAWARRRTGADFDRTDEPDGLGDGPRWRPQNARERNKKQRQPNKTEQSVGSARTLVSSSVGVG